MATIALDPTRECLTSWSEQHQRFEEDLQESFDALDAYQRQLDAWQQRLAGEREQLEHERERLKEQADAAIAAAEQGDQTAELEAELIASRQRTEELEQQIASSETASIGLQGENAKLTGELHQAQRAAQELGVQLEATRAEMAQQNQHWSGEFSRVVKMLEQQQAAPAADFAPAAVAAPAGASDPVLGSVVAQFSKLRQQRAERGLK
ncbi:Chromosome partition protein Smc [Posidoniimonas polymericola]|uniref:Chromosome partition protein Smc n=1 Tax=Posidoniimonas polymericola TaxID=2528002 RepID=A0A5C5YIF0_9BACT|nr:hypothetical protein [Posidoniimonas polymericola]TWT74642.1 Chromosome partition protein Smc [Posidoniimonas polymericola]